MAWDWISPDVDGDQHRVDAMVVASRPVVAGLREHVVGPVRGDVPELIEPAK